MGFLDGLSEKLLGKKPDAPLQNSQVVRDSQSVRDSNAQLSEQHRLDNMPASLSADKPFTDPNQKREDQNRIAEITQNLSQEQPTAQPQTPLSPTPEITGMDGAPLTPAAEPQAPLGNVAPEATGTTESTPSIPVTQSPASPLESSTPEPTIMSTSQESQIPQQPTEEPKAA